MQEPFCILTCKDINNNWFPSRQMLRTEDSVIILATGHEPCHAAKGHAFYNESMCTREAMSMLFCFGRNAFSTG